MHSDNDEWGKFWLQDSIITPHSSLKELRIICVAISADVCKLDFIRAHLHRKGPILHQMYTLFNLNACK